LETKFPKAFKESNNIYLKGDIYSKIQDFMQKMQEVLYSLFVSRWIMQEMQKKHI